MRNRLRLALLIGMAVLVFALGCSTVPYTRRSQFMVLPESQEVALGADAYREILSQSQLVHDPAFTEPVRTVGEHIARVADKPHYDWEFHVIDDDRQANAFALPGGKVAVYTGLFPVAQDTGGLAAVVAHEVGHALARHAGERMSQTLMLEIVATGLSVGLGGQSPATRQAVMQAFGLGAQVGVLLPFSRSQESEADRIGLILMAQAGYDPQAALDLWQRFEETNKQSPPEFLSTHPSYGTRQHNISSWLPEARSYYTADPAVLITPLPGVAVEDGAPADGGERDDLSLRPGT